ncbi:NUDIX domain-containing protein [Pseudomonas aeruginosa]|uniref:NUDIX domain-containing protein n=1 Tax=Pseudomonas aeruginosa TaxID=287 RepID=UPI0022434D91|nr:NUDIX domain-containing protein [Pseudomonas aeruginosa]MCW8366263.1 NUDIX domain-containing protein [Pseudomonas aeruginosa]
MAVQAAEAQAVVRHEVGRGTRCATAFEVGGRGANESPGTAVVREVYEETGLRVRARQLLALWDKQRHPHPPQLPHALKAFFLCVIVGGELRQRTDETLAAGYHEVAVPGAGEPDQELAGAGRGGRARDAVRLGDGYRRGPSKALFRRHRHSPSLWWHRHFRRQP